ncbi:extracellular solute-binding protein [Chelatococcus asaccharovorans]|uniref:extracellular solute-binding protein n=1 Tax=Chelatococcus asaccharovorans TaxID=28210 RepID=UPI00224C6E97|nr:extracellular solute-binding protein [Chelatococcus asaccharovorans]CAH1660898.1 Carbohydrate ABC transporter substrate-binding protein (CUT1 family) [Chelatococcus asaccharovorans]CAH1683631.1 Carbohydrate ABC transporter substrate-binding protein (CUT1 family) [Chelatococcus asaccharovorans]
MKQISTLGAAMLLALAATTCNAFAETKLTVSATPAIFKPMFESFARNFEAQNPGVKISLDIPAGDQEDMIQDLLRKSLIGNVPDVTFQGYNFIRTVVSRQLAQPLDAIIARDQEWVDKSVSPNVTASTVIDGQVYGVGVAYSFLVIYYNADLVKAAIGDAPFPATWDGLLSLAETIGQKNKDNIGGYIRPDSWVLQALVDGAGGTLADPKTNAPRFANEEGRDAFALLRQFGLAGQGNIPMSTDQARQAFAAGKIGFMTDASSILSRVEKETAGKFNLGVARFPIAGNGKIPAAGIAALMLTKDEERQKVAWQFLKFLTGVDGQIDVVNNTSYVPTNTVAIKDSAALRAALSKQPKMQTAIDTVPSASAWYAFPGANTARIDKEINDTMAAVVTLRQEPVPALKALEAKVKELQR